MIEYLESTGHTIVHGNYIPKDEEFVDHNDLSKLDEIRTKFLNSSWAEREKIYNKVIKDEGRKLDEFSNFDLFYHLDDTGFDFLDNIDSQEIISHLNAVGYYVIESSKY